MTSIEIIPSDRVIDLARIAGMTGYTIEETAGHFRSLIQRGYLQGEIRDLEDPDTGRVTSCYVMAPGETPLTIADRFGRGPAS